MYVQRCQDNFWRDATMHPISKVLVGGNGKIWEQNARLWPIYMVNISREDQKYLWRSIKHCKYQSQEWILTTSGGLVWSGKGQLAIDRIEMDSFTYTLEASGKAILKCIFVMSSSFLRLCSSTIQPFCNRGID